MRPVRRLLKQGPGATAPCTKVAAALSMPSRARRPAAFTRPVRGLQKKQALVRKGLEIATQDHPSVAGAEPACRTRVLIPRKEANGPLLATNPHQSSASHQMPADFDSQCARVRNMLTAFLSKFGTQDVIDALACTPIAELEFFGPAVGIDV